MDDEFLAAVAVVAPADGLADAAATRVAGHADRVLPLLPVRVGADGTLEGSSRWARLVTTLHDA